MIPGIKERLAGPSGLGETVGFAHCEGCLKHTDLWNREVSRRNRLFRRVIGDYFVWRNMRIWALSRPRALLVKVSYSRWEAQDKAGEGD